MYIYIYIYIYLVTRHKHVHWLHLRCYTDERMNTKVCSVTSELTQRAVADAFCPLTTHRCY